MIRGDEERGRVPHFGRFNSAHEARDLCVSKPKRGVSRRRARAIPMLYDICRDEVQHEKLRTAGLKNMDCRRGPHLVHRRGAAPQQLRVRVHLV